MKRYIEIKNGDKILFRHLKKKDVEGVWSNFNAVLKEGIYLPVFSPVSSDYEKVSWYESIKKEKEVCIVAEHPKLKSPFNILGRCEISNTEWEAGTHVGSLGIIVKENFRDQGLGFHLIDLAIRQSKLLNNKEKICLSCFSTNERALHLYEKMGFQTIGVRKKQFYLNSIYYDEVIMEIWVDDYISKG